MELLLILTPLAIATAAIYVTSKINQRSLAPQANTSPVSAEWKPLPIRDSLPFLGNYNGRRVYLTTDRQVYTFTDTGWRPMDQTDWRLMRQLERSKQQLLAYAKR